MAVKLPLTNIIYIMEGVKLSFLLQYFVDILELLRMFYSV